MTEELLSRICEDGKPDELWRLVPGWPEYAVSSLGRVMSAVSRKNTHAGRLIKSVACGNGYHRVGLFRNGSRKNPLVHRLVCEVFNGPPPTARHQAAHSNHDPADNRACNLRWATPLENHADMSSAGRRLRGEARRQAKLTDADVLFIRATNEISNAEIARQFRIAPSLVCGIRSRKRWTHI